jgi:hypothetical protein
MFCRVTRVLVREVSRGQARGKGGELLLHSGTARLRVESPHLHKKQGPAENASRMQQGGWLGSALGLSPP